MDNPAALPATESVSQRFRDLDAWAPSEALHAMWEGQMDAVAAVRPALPAIAKAVALAAQRLRRGGRLVYCGAGTSGRIGVQDGAELPPTFDWPERRLVLMMAGGDIAFTRSVENAEDDRAAARNAVAAHNIGAEDVVIGIAASGSTPFTVEAVRTASARGAATIGIANAPGSKLLEVASCPILVETGAEAVAGSTRMKAGTAQKVVLNLFSTALMVQLGRVHDGLMVDMLARNAKLRDRAVRMLRRLTGAGDNAIGDALERADGNVKTAVLLLRGLDRAAADAALAECDGHLRQALARL
ncbi:MAG: N-acetylmuramic acid 6-phosphate etherase [Acidisphaera sp.]|nr:N-acetylmuramic acid 6-phosphate etherase [Acidisphaera sp.]MBV9811176.1 N-acetylmuramic acid 6-phosphate etherase [Acetobacteraceae bacterium]